MSSLGNLRNKAGVAVPSNASILWEHIAEAVEGLGSVQTETKPNGFLVCYGGMYYLMQGCGLNNFDNVKNMVLYDNSGSGDVLDEVLYNRLSNRFDGTCYSSESSVKTVFSMGYRDFGCTVELRKEGAPKFAKFRNTTKLSPDFIIAEQIKDICDTPYVDEYIVRCLADALSSSYKFDLDTVFQCLHGFGVTYPEGFNIVARAFMGRYTNAMNPEMDLMLTQIVGFISKILYEL